MWRDRDLSLGPVRTSQIYILLYKFLLKNCPPYKRLRCYKFLPILFYEGLPVFKSPASLPRNATEFCQR